MTKKTKNMVNLEIPAELADQLRNYCHEHRLTKATIVRQLLTDLLRGTGDKATVLPLPGSSTNILT